MASNISAILLAAGESSRMGKLKQLLPFGKTTVIETCIANLLASNINELTVVLGHRADEITSVISQYPIKVVNNPDYSIGMSTSISAGIKAANIAATGLLFALVDQPLVNTSIINSVIEHYNASDLMNRITIPFCSGKGGHPVIFDSSLREELLNIDPTIGLREVKLRHSEEVLYFSVDDPCVVEDMDYWEDYERQLARLGADKSEQDSE